MRRENGLGRLDGKVAVITGGASGIGEGSVRRFVAEGARVVIADVQDERGQALAAECDGAAQYRHCDVMVEDEVRDALNAAVSSFGRLDVMFNNAGRLGATGPIAEITHDEFDSTIGLLLRGVFFGVKHAARVMVEQGSGSIINTASIAGVQVGWGPHLYSVAKAGVIQLTKTASVELGEKNVRVNCICPGGIATPLLQTLSGSRDVPMDQLRAGLAHSQPIPRAGEPEDVAQTAVWLASDEASFVTGAAIVVDGAMALGPMWSRQAPQFRERRKD